MLIHRYVVYIKEFCLDINRKYPHSRNSEAKYCGRKVDYKRQQGKSGKASVLLTELEQTMAFFMCLHEERDQQLSHLMYLIRVRPKYLRLKIRFRVLHVQIDFTELIRTTIAGGLCCDCSKG